MPPRRAHFSGAWDSNYHLNPKNNFQQTLDNEPTGTSTKFINA